MCGLCAASCNQIANFFNSKHSNAALIYLLRDGKFEAVRSSLFLYKREMLPWTAQERISDIAYSSDSIVMTINGYGALVIDVHDPSHPRFDYRIDRDFFINRTLTTMVPLGNDVFCHFYINSFLDPDPYRSIITPTEHVNFTLLRLKDNRRSFTPYPMPLQKDRRGFEAVGFVPATKTRWYLEWKLSGTGYTLFEYSIFDLAGKNETPSSRSEYRAAYNFTDLASASVPAPMRTLCDHIARSLRQDDKVTSYHFNVKHKETNLVERFIHKAAVDESDPNFEIVNVRLFTDGVAIVGIAGNNRIASVSVNGGTVTETGLPGLPDGYEYTMVFLHGRTAYCAWEENSFYKTGNAGLVTVQLP